MQKGALVLVFQKRLTSAKLNHLIKFNDFVNNICYFHCTILLFIYLILNIMTIRQPIGPLPVYGKSAIITIITIINHQHHLPHSTSPSLIINFTIVNHQHRQSSTSSIINIVNHHSSSIVTSKNVILDSA